MIKNFYLIQEGEELKNELHISVRQGESVNLILKNLDFEYSYANIRVNGIFVGMITGRQIGLHSSKMKIGLNELCIDFLDDKRCLKNCARFNFVVEPFNQDDKTLQEQYTDLLLRFEKLKQEVADLKSWKQEIDNERSGY